MDKWEFLVQQEGDQDWLSLDSPSVEILEGRYRLMARSSFPDASIEVRVSHIFTQDGVPKRRYQRRPHQSSPSGLVGVVPFTYLQPGLWKFSCRLMSADHPNGLDDVDSPWQGSVQLQVLPTSVTAETDWRETPPAAPETQILPELPKVQKDAPIPEQEQVTKQSAALSAASPAQEQFQPEQIQLQEPERQELDPPASDMTDTVLQVLTELMLPQASTQPSTSSTLPVAANEPAIEDLNLPGEAFAEPATPVNALEFNLSEPVGAAPEAVDLVDPVDFGVPVPAEVAESLPEVAARLEQSEPEAPAVAPRTLLSLSQSAYSVTRDQPPVLTGVSRCRGELVIQLREPRQQILLWQTRLMLQATTDCQSLPFRCPLELPANHQVLVGEVRLIPAATEAIGATDSLRQTQAFMVTIVEPEVMVPDFDPEPEPPSLLVESAEPVVPVRSLELPVFLEPLPALVLETVAGPTLPPQLYPAPQRSEPAKPLQLPVFPPRSQMASQNWQDADPAGQVQAPLQREYSSYVTTLEAEGVSESHRHSLTDQLESDDAAFAFESLQLGKRFWFILNDLAQVELLPATPSPKAAVSIGPSSISPNCAAAVGDPVLSNIDIALPHFVDDAQFDHLPVPELLLPSVLKAGQALRLQILLADSYPNVCVKFWAIDSKTQKTVQGPQWLQDFSYDPGTGILSTITEITLPANLRSVCFQAVAVDLSSQAEGQVVSWECPMSCSPG